MPTPNRDSWVYYVPPGDWWNCKNVRRWSRATCPECEWWLGVACLRQKKNGHAISVQSMTQAPSCSVRAVTGYFAPFAPTSTSAASL